MNIRTPKFKIVSDNKDVLLIEDIGPWNCFPTVTNGAEEVVKMLRRQLNGRRLEYIDSDGQRDQLLVKDGRFAGFAPAGEAK